MSIYTNLIAALEFILFVLKIFCLSFLVSLPFLYDLNARFRYYFKFFAYYWLFAFVNVILAPISAWTWAPIRGSNLSIFSFLHRTIGYILNIKWKVIDEKTLHLNQPCIIVTNQQNPVDILGIYNTFAATRKNIIIRYQRHHDWFNFFAWFISICNPILTLTEKDRKAVVSSILIKRMKIENANIWIFCNDLEKLETDILRVALQEGIPIIPLIFSDYYFLDHREKIFDPGVVTMQILPRLSPSEDNVNDNGSIVIKNMQQVMKKELKILSERVRPLTLDTLRQCYKKSV